MLGVLWHSIAGLVQIHVLIGAVGAGAAAWFFISGRVRLAAAILVAAILVSAWLMFQGLQAQLTASQAALAHARQVLSAAQDQLRLNHFASTEADNSARVDLQTRTIVRQAQRALTDAADRQDSHALYVVWTDGIGRLRNDPGAAVA